MCDVAQQAGHDHTDIWLFLHPILGLVVTSLAVLNVSSFDHLKIFFFFYDLHDY